MLKTIDELEAFFLNDESPTFEHILFCDDLKESLQVAKDRLESLNVDYDKEVLEQVIEKIKKEDMA